VHPRAYTSSAGRPVKRFLSAVLIGSLLVVSTSCGNVFIRGAINTGSTMTGPVTFVQVGNVLNETGGTVQVTCVTFLQNGSSSPIGFCDDQRAVFSVDQTVRVNFNPGRTCAPIIVVVIVVSRDSMAMKIEKISPLTFQVRNMKASLQFYRDALGLELLYGREGSGFSSLRAKDADSAILNLEEGPQGEHGVGSADLSRPGCGCLLEASDRLGIPGRQAAKCVLGRAVFSHARSGWA